MKFESKSSAVAAFACSIACLSWLGAPPIAAAGAAVGAQKAGSAAPAWNGLGGAAHADDQRAFAPAEWSDKLASSDLDARERAYDELRELAQRDDAARRWVEENARGASGDVAWTCRLLQRELDTPAHAFSGLRDPLDWNMPSSGAPFGGADLQQLRERMQQMFNELQGHIGNLPASPGNPVAPTAPAAPAAPGPRAPAGGAAAQDSSRSVQLEQGPDGCKVTITEDVDGKRESRTYTAKSLEELLQAQPELREKIGVTIETPRAFSLGGGRGWPSFDPHAWGNAFGGNGLGGNGLGGNALGGNAFGGRLFGNGADAWKSLDGIDANGPLRTDILGVFVTAVPDERATRLGLDDGRGLLVQRTEPGTIASVLGISGGDVIVEMNGRAIHDSADIGAVLRERKSGAELTVTWYDSWGKQRTRTWRDEDGPRESSGAAKDAADHDQHDSRPLRLPKQDA